MAYSKLITTFREKNCFSSLERDQEPKIRCINCRIKERLYRFDDLRKGSHICMGGQRLMFSFHDQQVAAYTHHAIVKSKEIVSHSTAQVTMIHFFTTPYDMSIRIQETTELLDLQYHEINIIRYRNATHLPDTIIERAERLIALNRHAKYSVFSCNCEHICNWCCVGNAKSFQADNVKTVLSNMLTSIAGNSFGVVIRLFLLTIENASTITSSCLVGVPWGVMSVIAIFYLIYAVYQHLKLNEERSNGNICSTCARHKKADIWCQFVVYCGLQAGGFGLLSLITSVAASHGIVLGSLLVCIVLSFICISGISKLRKQFVSPIRGRSLKIMNMKNIWIGDVISFQHWKTSHYCIVSSVKIFPGTNFKTGMLKIIHYSQHGIFERRRIVEEDKTIDLNTEIIFGHDYSGYYVHEPENVVNRARQRIGEAKFKLRSNRSCHFCHWAKVNEDSENESKEEDKATENVPKLFYLKEIDPALSVSLLPTQSVHINHTRGRKHTSKSIGTRLARIRDEVTEGQLIEFKHNGLSHKAITTKVHFDVKIPSKLYVTLVHHGKKRNICEDTIEFDLNHEDIWIYKYHPLYMHSKSDIISRARARIHEGKDNILKYVSSNFTREVVEKSHVSDVLDLREIVLGDVISFTYRSFLHEAIVSGVTQEPLSTTKGEITVIHYSRGNILARRTITEETFSINLQTESWNLVNYEGYVTYPPNVVIQRARARIGEQRHSICGNTSADFVHWAKVVQKPVVMSEYDSSQNVEIGVRLLVPKAGRRVDEFQRFKVRIWPELSPGIIIEYKLNLCKNFGIISHVNEKKNCIKVIQYCGNLCGPKSLREINMNLDLHHDDIWLYRGHPRRCNKPKDVVAIAFKRLGEKKPGKGDSSWEFCKECVLRKV